jgi:hypothetical protein
MRLDFRLTIAKVCSHFDRQLVGGSRCRSCIVRTRKYLPVSHDLAISVVVELKLDGVASHWKCNEATDARNGVRIDDSSADGDGQECRGL